MAKAAKRPSSRSKTAQSRSGARGGTKSRSGARAAAAKTRSTARGSARGAPRRRSGADTASRRAGNAGSDATALLKADHRTAEELFERFESARGLDRHRARLARTQLHLFHRMLFFRRGHRRSVAAGCARRTGHCTCGRRRGTAHLWIAQGLGSAAYSCGHRPARCIGVVQAVFACPQWHGAR